MFVTVFYGILNTRTGDLEFASGGHTPPYLLSGGKVTLLNVKPACPPGMIEGENYETWQGQLRPGDTLLLYTDGVTEAADRAGNFFSEQGVETYLRGAAGLSPKEVVNGLVAEVRKFIGEAPQSDDITALAAQYLG
jgi:sigma-B regulation protein RsbU (phosphoserine phosphatase)